MKRKLFCIGMCIAMIVTLMPTAAFAAQTGAMQGVIAVASENDTGDQIEYTYSAPQEEIMRLPYSTSWWYSYGTDHAGNFEGAKDITEAEIIIEKDEKQLGHKKFSLGKEIVTEGEIPGIYYSIWHDEENGKLTSIDYSFHFDLDLDAYKHLTTLAGTYQITVNWLAGGQNYTASVQYVLRKDQVLTEINQIEYDNAGYVSNIWSKQYYTGSEVQYPYNPLESYGYQNADDGRYAREIVKRYVFTDCDYDGFFQFERCETAEMEGIFCKGEPIVYDAETKLVPLEVHPKLITAEMIGQSAVLVFKNGTVEKTITVTISEEENNFLQEGTLYAVSSGRVQLADEAGDVVRIYCGESGELSEMLKTKINMRLDETDVVSFVTYQNRKLHQRLASELSKEDTALLNMTYYEASGIKTYELTPMKCGSVDIKAAGAEASPVTCSFTLPEIGFYRSAERSEAHYLGDEFHFKTAYDKEQDGSEAYVYLIVPTCGYREDQIKVSCGRWNTDGAFNVWEEETVKGITIDAPTIQTFPDGTTYAISKISVSRDYRNDDQKWQRFGIVYNGGEGVNARNLRIYDSEEILEDEQLYWFYKDGVTPMEDGKLKVSNENDGSIGDKAMKQEDWPNKSGKMIGYFAIKNGADFYALRDVKAAETAGIPCTVSASADEPYVYTILWSDFGTYLFAANAGGKTYYFHLSAKLPKVGFYSHPERNEKNCIDQEFHFIDAEERNEEGTEAYFYLIAHTKDYPISQIKASFGSWQNQGDGQTHWQDKIIPGISMDAPELKTFGSADETYAVWKLTVTRDYQKESLYHPFAVFYGDSGTLYEGTEIRIYDAAEIPQKEKLYWFNPEQVQVRSNGRLYAEGRDLNELAIHGEKTDSRSAASYGYFAVLLADGSYQAIPTDKITVPKEMRIYEANNKYMSLLEWGGYGEYMITAAYDGQSYRMPWIVYASNYGFFLSKEVNEDSKLGCKFSFNYAREKSKDGNEAYFYMIGDFYGGQGQTSEIKIINGALGNVHEMRDNEIEGITFGETEMMEYGDNTYFVCRVTVPKTFDASKELWIGLCYGEIGEGYYWYSNLSILGGAYFFGDADGNKKVDFSDVLYMKRYLANWEKYQNISETADTNASEGINLEDLMILERHVAGWKGYAMLPYVENVF